MHLDLGHFVDAQHHVIVEVALFDLAILESDFAVQGSTQTEGDRRLHLRLDRQRVHNGTTVDRTNHPMHADLAILDRDFSNLGNTVRRYAREIR